MFLGTRFSHVVLSGERFVDVGYYGRIYTTRDGVNRTGREFVAAGSSDSIYTSPDGNTWTPQYMGRGGTVKSLLWANSMLFAAGGWNDDSASLLIGTIDETPVNTPRRNAAASPIGRNRPILYTGTFPSRITQGGVLYGLDGRRVGQISPAGRAGRQTTMRGIPNGVWILQWE
jgi:hypothetical protein